MSPIEQGVVSSDCEIVTPQAASRRRRSQVRESSFEEGVLSSDCDVRESTPLPHRRVPDFASRAVSPVPFAIEASDSEGSFHGFEGVDSVPSQARNGSQMAQDMVSVGFSSNQLYWTRSPVVGAILSEAEPVLTIPDMEAVVSEKNSGRLSSLLAPMRGRRLGSLVISERVSDQSELSCLDGRVTLDNMREVDP